jgi:hypothetical protein
MKGINRTSKGKRLIRKRNIEDAQYEVIYHAVTGAKLRVKKRQYGENNRYPEVEVYLST